MQYLHEEDAKHTLYQLSYNPVKVAMSEALSTVVCGFNLGTKLFKYSKIMSLRSWHSTCTSLHYYCSFQVGTYLVVVFVLVQHLVTVPLGLRSFSCRLENQRCYINPVNLAFIGQLEEFSQYAITCGSMPYTKRAAFEETEIRLHLPLLSRGVGGQFSGHHQAGILALRRISLRSEFHLP